MSILVLMGLQRFSADWAAVMANSKIEGAENLTSTVSLMSFLVTWGSVATIATLISVGLFFLWFTRARVVNPLLRLTKAIDQLAGGNATVTIPYATHQDEIGVMARAVLVLKENTVEKLRLEAEQAELKRRSEDDRRRVLGDLAGRLDESVGHVVETLSGAATALQSNAQLMLSSCDDARERSSAIASTSKVSSTSVESLAAAANALSDSISDIERQTGEATGVAQTGMRQVAETNEVVAGLSDTVNEIGQVVGMIGQIAEQTNLLALNATIESARAGMAGKGFAVVASEVKNLAGQAGRATEEVTQKIQQIQEVTNRAVATMTSVAQTIERIGGIVTSIAAAVERQSGAAKTIAHNVDTASDGTKRVYSDIERVASATESTGKTADEVMRSARSVNDKAHDLRATVDGFLQKLRSA
ncbi:methyl-accepting chemotaxis protein [Skermanella stibiiresistens]|uniref:methyl-accepting chemotaxis protein n=1 Tax=Skermanella stibiiresistens TaxID=913326 RepID=UPI0018DB182A|nr:methyl-accepting chemotaxis protein [Skermanella stibiiresistens]